MTEAELARKEGYQKIMYCCRQAQRDGLKYCWVDTCSIDKSSSAELSEAINSMFRYYGDAKVCYAYLSATFPKKNLLSPIGSAGAGHCRN